jgi:alkaline phosphatase D
MHDELLRTLHAFEREARINPKLSRRSVLRRAAGLALGALAAPLAQAQGTPPPRIRFTGYPFTLGVASGYPRSDRVALWTRLAPSPLEIDGGMQPENVDVQWELAEDERFARVVASGRVRAVPELAHSLRVEARGLAPARWYHYRFHCGDAVSSTGRTRTADAADAMPAKLRLGLGSCQHFEQGWFAAHRHLLAEDLDLMLFVGDYIYESDWGKDRIRRHAGIEPITLAGYRVRHAQYKSDPDLQRLHAAVPWAFAWDDHEVDNDYADARSEHLDPAFLLRRAAAYQAYFEHMPLAADMLANGPALRLYSVLDFGRLARICLLDDRQYRSAQVCPDAYKGGGSTEVAPAMCPEIDDPARTLLGAEQERWFDARCADTRARWNVIAQQTLLAPFPTPRPDGKLQHWTDGWDGYPAARARLLASLTRHRVANPVVLGGDLHATVVCNVPSDPARPESSPIAAEFCGTSINAEGLAQEFYAARLPINPHVRFVDATRRGYMTVMLEKDRTEVVLRTLDDVTKLDASISTANRWTVAAGTAGIARS